MTQKRSYLEYDKICSRCLYIGKDFSPNQSHCRKCCAEKTESWRKRNPDKVLEMQRREREENWPHNYQRMRKYREEHKEKTLWTYARDRARKRQLEFSIQPTDIYIPECCPVFGIKLSMNNPKSNGKPSDDSMSLDRIDPRKGYTPDNIWVISHRANWIKNRSTLEELELLTSAIKRKIYGKT